MCLPNTNHDIIISGSLVECRATERTPTMTIIIILNCNRLPRYSQYGDIMREVDDGRLPGGVSSLAPHCTRMHSCKDGAWAGHESLATGGVEGLVRVKSARALHGQRRWRWRLLLTLTCPVVILTLYYYRRQRVPPFSRTVFAAHVAFNES